MNFFSSLSSLFLSANTHFVGNAGLGTCLGAIVVHVAAKVLDPHGNGQGLAQVALTTLDTYAAAPVLATGSIAAYFGRPKTVPAVPQITIGDH